MKVDVTTDEFEILCKKWKKSTTGLEENTKSRQVQGEKFSFIKDVGTTICYILFLDELENRGKNEELVEICKDNIIAPTKPVKIKDDDEYEKLIMKIKIKVLFIIYC
jgi:hypothetical protein